MRQEVWIPNRFQSLAFNSYNQLTPTTSQTRTGFSCKIELHLIFIRGNIWNNLSHCTCSLTIFFSLWAFFKSLFLIDHLPPSVGFMCGSTFLYCLSFLLPLLDKPENNPKYSSSNITLSFRASFQQGPENYHCFNQASFTSTNMCSKIP